MVVAAEGEAVLPAASRPPAAHRRRRVFLFPAAGHILQRPPRAAAGLRLRRAAVVPRDVPPPLGGAIAAGAPTRRPRHQLAVAALHLRRGTLRARAPAAGLPAGALLRLHHGAVQRVSHAPGARPPPGPGRDHQPVVPRGPLRSLPRLIDVHGGAAELRRAFAGGVPAAAGEPDPPRRLALALAAAVLPEAAPAQ